MSTQYVTFTLDGELYGVGVDRVQEGLPPRTLAPVPLAPPEVAGLVNLRGQVVLAIDLRHRLGLPPRETQEQMMVVIEVGGEPMSLLVDEIGDVVRADPASFEEPPQTLAAELRSVITGAYKLDGRLLLALDVAAATAS